LPADDAAAPRALRRRARLLALLPAAKVLLAVELGYGHRTRAAGEHRGGERAVVGGLAVLDVRRWAERAARARSQHGRPVLAFHGGARDCRAAADGTLAGLRRDEHAVRTPRRGARRGGPATSGACRAGSGDAARAGPPAVTRRARSPSGAGVRRLQRPAVTAGDPDSRERQGAGERPERAARPTRGRRASAVPTHHAVQNGRISGPGQASRGEANDPKNAWVRAVAATRPNSNPRHRRFVWRTAVQSLNSRTPKRPRE
jgi:hypothetical protein